MNRRKLLLAAAPLLTAIPTPSHAEWMRDKISATLLSATLLLALKNESGARREAYKLKEFSRIDPKWMNYAESFQLALILTATTPPSERAAWIEANNAVVETFPGAVDSPDSRKALRFVASSAEALLQAESPTPRYLTRDHMGRVAGLLLFLAGACSGPERTRWAQVALAGLRRFGDQALEAWSHDAITPRFMAAGVATAGNWADATSRYGEILRRGEGSMDNMVKPASALGQMGGLRGLIAGSTVVEAEAATAYAMSGQFVRALELLEQSRRLTPSAQRPLQGTAGASALEAQLLADGTVLVQPVSSLIGAFALVSVRRGGRIQRFTAVDLAPGGLELFHRLVSNNTKMLSRDGLMPKYLSVRRTSGDAGREKLQLYVTRAATDAEQLIGGAIRKALQAAKVTSREDVLVILPANLAMLPIGASRREAAAPALAEAYQLRFSDSLRAARLSQIAAVPRSAAPASAAVLSGLPARDLKYLSFEASSVLGAFPEAGRRRVDETAATAGLAAFGGATHWHLASHAAWDFNRPERSGVAVSRRRVVTMSEVLDAHFASPPRLIFLSACETAFVDIKQDLNRFRSLPSALTAAGATAVVGSLWPVSDAATALLAVRFYDEHQAAKLPPATALRAAQSWLRQATGAQLQDYVTDKVARRHTPLADAAGISARLASLDPSSRPFAHPYYWAGFQTYGR